MKRVIMNLSLPIYKPSETITHDRLKRFQASSAYRGERLSEQAVGQGVCRTWGIGSEQAVERGKILTISPAHGGTMVPRNQRNINHLNRFAPDSFFVRHDS